MGIHTQNHPELLLGTEAPVMTLSGMEFAFLAHPEAIVIFAWPCWQQNNMHV